jgi:hypothetical protein
MQNNGDDDNNFRSYRKVGVPVIIGMTIQKGKCCFNYRYDNTER